MAKEQSSRLRIFLVLGRALYDLTLKFPFLFLKWTIPALRPHPNWSYKACIGALLCKTVLRIAGLGRKSPSLILETGKEKNQFQIVKPATDLQGVAASTSLIKPVPTYGIWYPTIPPGQVKGNIVLHFHGGAYVWLSARRADSGWSADQYVEHVVDYVFMADYRMASRQDGSFPAQLQDAIGAYQHILSLGIDPSQIILAGDSAGGHLVISLLRYITTTMANAVTDPLSALPLPKAALLWSPATDFLTPCDESTITRNTLYDIDVIPSNWLSWGARCFTHGVDVSSPTIQPYIVPVGHPFKTGISIWLSICGQEILRDDALRWADEMRAHGNEVEVNVEELAAHDLFYGCITGFADEGVKAFKEVGRWVSEL